MMHIFTLIAEYTIIPTAGILIVAKIYLKIEKWYFNLRPSKHKR